MIENESERTHEGDSGSPFVSIVTNCLSPLTEDEKQDPWEAVKKRVDVAVTAIKEEGISNGLPLETQISSPTVQDLGRLSAEDIASLLQASVNFPPTEFAVLGKITREELTRLLGPAHTVTFSGGRNDQPTVVNEIPASSGKLVIVPHTPHYRNVTAGYSPFLTPDFTPPSQKRILETSCSVTLYLGLRGIPEGVAIGIQQTMSR